MAECSGESRVISEAKIGNLINALVMSIIHLLCGRLTSFLFKGLGQPRVIIQMITGMLVGVMAKRISPYKLDDFVKELGETATMFFAFLMGLELDARHLWNTHRLPSIIFGANMGAAVVLATPIYYNLAETNVGFWKGAQLFVALVVLLANSASPILFRMCADIKVANTEIGRAAIFSALFNDLACLLIVSLVGRDMGDSYFYMHAIGIFVVVPLTLIAAVFGLRAFARLLNRLHPDRKTIKFSEILIILLLILWVGGFNATMGGFSGVLSAFILGLFFPREGKAIRTLLTHMVEPVHKILLPVYFSFLGSQANYGIQLHRDDDTWVTYAVSGTSIVGKLASTVAAAKYLKMSLVEGLTLGFLLHVKGYSDIYVLDFAQHPSIISNHVYRLLVTTVVIGTIFTVPVVTFIVRCQRRALAFNHYGLELAPPDSQLHLLTCVYGPRHMPAALNLIEMSRGADRNPFTPYLMHLIELTEKTPSNLLYNQRPDEEEEEDYGGEDTRLVNASVDAYIRETGMTLYELKAVSDFRNMHEDVCNAAEDVRTSIIILPFHKHRRYDGLMEVTNEGYRLTNRKVQERARCTVALLVDRGIGGANARSGGHQHVVALFFGGPDDREALTYAARLAEHPVVSLTVVRFLPATEKEYEAGVAMETNKDDEVLTSIAKLEAENHADRDFLFKYCERYVTTGLVTYVEKYVENSAETITTLSSMDRLYSLYIVGRGGRGLSPLTAGMGDWEECPELGAIGDLLASSDFRSTGSVLVVQQYRRHNKEREVDEFKPL